MAQIVSLKPLYELLPSPHKKYAETLVFVHHYGGHKFSHKKTMDWLNELGFDVVTFNFTPNNLVEVMLNPKKLSLALWSKEWKFGFRHIWADKVEEVLSSIKGDKIIFSYSSPSASALHAISKRNAIDVKAIICEGGPFAHLDVAFDKLIAFERKRSKSIITKKLPNFIQIHIYEKLFGFKNYIKETRADLLNLPKAFPVLSIRSEKDQLVAPYMVDEHFIDAFTHIDFTRMTLYKSDHLIGFKSEPEVYKKEVSDFLKFKATLITT